MVFHSGGGGGGAALGPLLFLIYTNDLSSRVSSTARHFADDCLLYRMIPSPEDAVPLPEDMGRLKERGGGGGGGGNWQMIRQV